MWPFKSAEERLAARTAKAFARYISPAELKRLTENPLPSAQAARVEYLVVALDDDSWAAPRERIDELHELINKHGGMYESCMPPVIKAVFGQPFPRSSDALRRPVEEIAVEVLDRFGRHAKLVHGSADCIYGNIGGSKRLFVGSLIPGFDQVLTTLFELEFGSRRAIDSRAS
jgi:hypothetical protein